MTSGSISIVIPALNSVLIGQVIQAIRRQKHLELVREIVIVGKDDLELIQQDELVRYIDTGSPVSPATARNIGIKATSGSIIIFIDSDCLSQSNWLHEHWAAHQAGYQVVGGSVLPDGEGYWRLSYNLAMFHEYLSTDPSGPRPYLPTLNLSVEREVIDKVGLMDESLLRSQDLEWTTRMYAANFQPYFWAQAVIKHQHNRDSLKKLWKDCDRSGYFSSQVRLQYQSTMNTPPLLASRHLIRLLAPFIAGWITFRIILRKPAIMFRFWYSIPAIFLSKIAWCWGAGRAK